MKTTLVRIVTLLFVVAFVLGACAPAAPTAAPTAAPAAKPAATSAPAATKAPEPTKAPAATTAPVATKPPAPTNTPVLPTSAPAPALAAGKILVTVAQDSDPATLDPQKAGAQSGGNIIFNVFEGLIQVTQDMKDVKPGLATEWKMVDDITWEFKLRKGVKFHNGEDFNAAVVKYTVERAFKPNVARSISDLTTIKEAVVVDDYTVRLITKVPDPLLAIKVFGLSMIPPKYDTQVGEDIFGRAPIGTGPYKMVEFTPGKRIVLDAFEGYWGGKPAVDRLIFKPVPEISTRVAELMAGTSDIILNINPEDIKDIKANSKLRVASVPSKRVVYMGLDVLPDGPKFMQDKRVRQALNYATDVDGIIQSILSGYGTRISTIYRPDFIGYDAALKPYPYNPAKAKELLAAAGYKPGDIKLKVTGATGITLKAVEIAEAVAAMWKDVGINAEANIVAYNIIRDMYIGTQKAHKGDAAYTWNWGSRQADADSPLMGTLHTTGITSYVRDETLDKMIIDVGGTADMAKRAEKAKAIQAYIYDQAYFVFMFVSADIYGVNNRLDWTPRNDQYLLGKEIKIK